MHDGKALQNIGETQGSSYAIVDLRKLHLIQLHKELINDYKNIT